MQKLQRRNPIEIANTSLIGATPRSGRYRLEHITIFSAAQGKRIIKIFALNLNNHHALPTKFQSHHSDLWH